MSSSSHCSKHVVPTLRIFALAGSLNINFSSKVLGQVLWKITQKHIVNKRLPKLTKVCNANDFVQRLGKVVILNPTCSNALEVADRDSFLFLSCELLVLTASSRKKGNKYRRSSHQWPLLGSRKSGHNWSWQLT